jgi:hypothetical protein
MAQVLEYLPSKVQILSCQNKERKKKLVRQHRKKTPLPEGRFKEHTLLNVRNAF